MAAHSDVTVSCHLLTLPKNNTNLIKNYKIMDIIHYTFTATDFKNLVSGKVVEINDPPQQLILKFVLEDIGWEEMQKIIDNARKETK